MTTFGEGKYRARQSRHFRPVGLMAAGMPRGFRSSPSAADRTADLYASSGKRVVEDTVTGQPPTVRNRPAGSDDMVGTA